MVDFWIGLVEEYGILGIVLMAVAVVLWSAQMYYYAARLYRLPRHRNRTESSGRPISVVVVIHHPDDLYIDDTLPQLLGQEYGEFEVVVVDVAGDEFYTQRLNLMAQQDERLTVARVARNERMRLSEKVALNIGIKSAHFENIVLTTTSAVPRTALWLASFGKAFGQNADVVLGYCAVERGRGRQLMRLDSFTAQVRHLASALRGRPYCGTVHNLGFARTLYFEAGGFTHLNLERGIEDLFIQRVAHRRNVAVITSPAGVVERKAWGGTRWWLAERRAAQETLRYYPPWMRRAASVELIVRGLLFAVLIAIAIVMPLEIALGAGALYIIRMVTVMLSLNGVRRRLRERRIIRQLPLYDLCAPLYELTLRIAAIIRPASRWR